MEEKEKSYIQQVKVEKLWGKYDICWDLEPDVNILVGGNGMGKSTLLRLIYEGIGFHNLERYESGVLPTDLSDREIKESKRELHVLNW